MSKLIKNSILQMYKSTLIYIPRSMKQFHNL